jgi:hypothetical protein
MKNALPAKVKYEKKKNVQHVTMVIILKKIQIQLLVKNAQYNIVINVL